MSEYRRQPHPGEGALLANRIGSCNRLLLGIALLTLCTCEALAGESAGQLTRPLADGVRGPAGPGAKPFTLFGPPYTAVTGPYALPELAEAPSYSAKDFRPRGRSVFESETRGPAQDNLAFDTTIWQRLDEYRNRDRIRVLTLWESNASAVSLQTGKGGPTLQWTSRLMNRGGATHGLLDRLLPVSLFTGGLHGIPGHTTSSVSSKTPSILTTPRSTPSTIP